MSHVEPSVEANEAAAPSAKGPPCPRRQAPPGERTVFSRVAPAITGSATWRESRLASSRVNRRRRAAASVAPLRETPGEQRARLREPEPQRVAGAGVLVVRVWGARSARAIATDPATSPRGDRRRRAEMALDRPLERVADDRRGHERQGDERQAPAQRRARPRRPRRAG